MKRAFGYELLPEDQKAVGPPPDPSRRRSLVAKPSIVPFAKRDAVFNQVFATTGGSRRGPSFAADPGVPVEISPGLNGNGTPGGSKDGIGVGPRGTGAGAGGTGTGATWTFADPFDLTSGGVKVSGKGAAGASSDALVAAGNTAEGAAGGNGPAGNGTNGNGAGPGGAANGGPDGSGSSNSGSGSGGAAGVGPDGVGPSGTSAAGGTGLGDVAQANGGPANGNGGNGPGGLGSSTTPGALVGGGAAGGTGPNGNGTGAGAPGGSPAGGGAGPSGLGSGGVGPNGLGGGTGGNLVAANPGGTGTGAAPGSALVEWPLGGLGPNGAAGMNGGSRNGNGSCEWRRSDFRRARTALGDRGSAAMKERHEQFCQMGPLAPIQTPPAKAARCQQVRELLRAAICWRQVRTKTLRIQTAPIAALARTGSRAEHARMSRSSCCQRSVPARVRAATEACRVNSAILRAAATSRSPARQVRNSAKRLPDRRLPKSDPAQQHPSCKPAPAVRSWARQAGA